MMRLIDGDKLLGVIAEQETWNVPDFVYESIKNAPTIEAEPVRYGKWIDCTSSDHWKCSKCGYKAPLWWDGEKYEEWLSQYCPHCGAKMLKEGE